MIDLIKSFYKFKTDPFRLVSDSQFTYLHPSYKKALAYLKFTALREEGFVMITGKPGTGKTTLINDVIASFDANEIMSAVLVTTQLKAHDLLHMVASLFRIDFSNETKSTLLLSIEHFLRNKRDEGRRVLLVVDEAQGLRKEAIEELRLLSNLVSGGKPMLQIFLIGQEELRDLVRSPKLEQLRQRIVAAAHLEPLSEENVFGYIQYRLSMAGWTGDPQIENAVVKLVHYYSNGIPRIVNLIFGRLLLHGCIEEKHELCVSDLQTIISELKEEHLVFNIDDLSDEEIFEPDGKPDGFLEPLAQPQKKTEIEVSKEDDSVEARAEVNGSGNIAISMRANVVALPTVEPKPKNDKPAGIARPQIESGVNQTRFRVPVVPLQKHTSTGAGIESTGGTVGLDRSVQEPKKHVRITEIADKNNRSQYGKILSRELPQTDSKIEKSRPGRIRLLVLLAGVALLVVMALLVLASEHRASIREKDIAIITEKVLGGVIDLAKDYDDKLLKVTSDMGVKKLLIEGDQDLLKAREDEIRSMFPDASNLRLLPSGIYNKADTEFSPPLGYAALAQIRAAETSVQPPPIEVHLVNTPQQHISIVRRIMSQSDGRVAGTIMLSLSVNVLHNIFDELQEINGYLELQQIGSKDEPGVVIMAHGDQREKEGGSKLVFPIKATRLQVIYWPEAVDIWGLARLGF